jgi:hypothetical protein
LTAWSIIMTLSFPPLNFLACCGLLSLLSGCGALTDVRSFSTPYTTPAGSETARLRVISDGMVRGVPQSDCVNFRLPGAGVMVAAREGYANRNGENLDMPPAAAQPSSTVMTEVKISAGQPMAFHYIGDRCYNMFSFVPEAGADYELEAAGRYRCTVTLKRLIAGSTKYTPAPLGDSKLCNWGDNF